MEKKSDYSVLAYKNSWGEWSAFTSNTNEAVKIVKSKTCLTPNQIKNKESPHVILAAGFMEAGR